MQGTHPTDKTHFLCLCPLSPALFTTAQFIFNVSDHVFLSSNASQTVGSVQMPPCCDHNQSHRWEVCWQSGSQAPSPPGSKISPDRSDLITSAQAGRRTADVMENRITQTTFAGSLSRMWPLSFSGGNSSTSRDTVKEHLPNGCLLCKRQNIFIYVKQRHIKVRDNKAFFTLLWLLHWGFFFLHFNKSDYTQMCLGIFGVFLVILAPSPITIISLRKLPRSKLIMWLGTEPIASWYNCIKCPKVKCIAASHR